jgi:hypothetical protein
MLILEKDVLPDIIEWKIKEFDTTTNSWTVIGMTQVNNERMLSILTSLKDLPVEIREKIFYKVVTIAFQEWYILKNVTQQIQIEYEAENLD